MDLTTAMGWTFYILGIITGFGISLIVYMLLDEKDDSVFQNLVEEAPYKGIDTKEPNVADKNSSDRESTGG